MAGGLGRRTFLSGFAALAMASRAEASQPSSILTQAIARLGGRRVLSRVRTLRWAGDAMVHAGGRDIAIQLETEVIPFISAHSRSWPTAQGTAQARTMIITADGGWVERDGTRSSLPAPMVANERAQYALYGLMLLVPLMAPGAARPLPREGGLAVIEANRPPAPPTRLYFEADGRLAEARNSVPNAEGGPALEQRFVFSREAMPGPVRWPRRLEIHQNGALFFELTLSRFEAV